MDRVVDFERRRVRKWRVIFWGVIGILAIIFVVSLIQALQIIQERGTFDLLMLFTQDQEIIAEFWQDSLATFYEELPHRRLLITVVMAVAVVGIFWLTKKGRKIIARRAEQLRKYSQ